MLILLNVFDIIYLKVRRTMMEIIENITNNPWPVIISLILIIVAMIAYLIGNKIKNKDGKANSTNMTQCKSNCIHILKHDLIYIAVIGVLVIIVLTTQVLYGNSEFGNQLNFAATVSSIILSVLAIMMTINGENKQEITKGSIDKSTNTIREASEKLGTYIQKIENINIGEIDDDMKFLQKLMREVKLKLEEHGTDLSTIKGSIQFQQNQKSSDEEKLYEQIDKHWPIVEIIEEQGDESE